MLNRGREELPLFCRCHNNPETDDIGVSDTDNYYYLAAFSAARTVPFPSQNVLIKIPNVIEFVGHNSRQLTAFDSPDVMPTLKSTTNALRNLHQQSIS